MTPNIVLDLADARQATEPRRTRMRRTATIYFHPRLRLRDVLALKLRLAAAGLHYRLRYPFCRPMRLEPPG